jgi:hypothetical protein
MSQVTFTVIVLFAFREHERGAALGTRYLKVWHRGFSTRVIEDHHSLALRSAGGAFLSTTGRGAKALFSSNARRKALASRRFVDLSLLHHLGVFKLLEEPSTEKLWRNVFTSLVDVACAPHIDRKKLTLQTAYWLLAAKTEVCIILATRVPTFD